MIRCFRRWPRPTPCAATSRSPAAIRVPSCARRKAGAHPRRRTLRRKARGLAGRSIRNGTACSLDPTGQDPEGVRSLYGRETGSGAPVARKPRASCRRRSLRWRAPDVMKRNRAQTGASPVDRRHGRYACASELEETCQSGNRKRVHRGPAFAPARGVAAGQARPGTSMTHPGCAVWSSASRTSNDMQMIPSTGTFSRTSRRKERPAGRHGVHGAAHPRRPRQAAQGVPALGRGHFRADGPLARLDHEHGHPRICRGEGGVRRAAVSSTPYNMVKYYEYVRENYLFLSHALITPQTDRSKSSVAAGRSAYPHGGGQGDEGGRRHPRRAHARDDGADLRRDADLQPARHAPRRRAARGGVRRAGRRARPAPDLPRAVRLGQPLELRPPARGQLRGVRLGPDIRRRVRALGAGIHLQQRRAGQRALPGHQPAQPHRPPDQRARAGEDAFRGRSRSGGGARHQGRPVPACPADARRVHELRGARRERDHPRRGRVRHQPPRAASAPPSPRSRPCAACCPPSIPASSRCSRPSALAGS